MRNISLEKTQNKLVATVSRENAIAYLGEAGESSKNTAEKIETVLKELDEKYQKNLKVCFKCKKQNYNIKSI